MVAEEGPIGIPFLNHWKVGDEPPKLAAAVKVTEVPWQNELPGEAETVTAAGPPVVTERDATVLVTVEQVPVTTALNWVPSMETSALFMAKVAEVTPRSLEDADRLENVLPPLVLICHW